MYAMSTEQRNWSMMAHLAGGLSMFFLPTLGFLGPALVWLAHKDNSIIAYHARQAMAFQLGLAVAGWVLGLLGAAFSCFLVGFGFWAIAAMLWPLGVAVPIWASIQVNNGEDWRYPFTGQMVDPR